MEANLQTKIEYYFDTLNIGNLNDDIIITMDSWDISEIASYYDKTIDTTTLTEEQLAFLYTMLYGSLGSLLDDAEKQRNVNLQAISIQFPFDWANLINPTQEEKYIGIV